ncbi:MAG: ABC transporter permease subunit, partial [Acidimicrobiia bacterium]
RIAWGTFIGLTATVWVSVAAGLGLVSVVLAPVVVLDDLASIGVAALATLAAAAVGVALGLLISASAAGRSQATALAAATWFVGALGIDIVVAAIAPSAFGAGGLLGVALINPIESVRLLALLLIDTEALGPFGGYLLDRFGAAGSVGMLGTSVVFWVLAPMWLATLVFRRRDV